MKKVAVLVLLMSLNIGAVAQELIFQDGFESGWPNAWAASVGWSPFFVKDSTGALVGPVVGWWSQGDDEHNPVGVPLTATIIDGRKVVLQVSQHALFTGRKVYFQDEDCQGQAWICVTLCDGQDSDYVGELSTYLMGAMYGIGAGNVLYRAEPPSVSPPHQAYASVAYVWPERDHGGFTCSNGAGVTANRIYAAEPVIDLDTLFTPPFSVE